PGGHVARGPGHEVARRVAREEFRREFLQRGVQAVAQIGLHALRGADRREPRAEPRDPVGRGQGQDQADLAAEGGAGALARQRVDRVLDRPRDRQGEAGGRGETERATAASSSTMRRYMRHVSGVSRITPIGDRARAVVPAWALINRYFSQSTRRMSAETSTGTPAAARASRSRMARGLTRPSSSPKTIRPSSVWAMRPGDSMVAKTKAAPPSARPRPSTS